MQDQKTYVAELQSAISQVRLTAYRRSSDSSDLDAVARYLWNIAMSEALYPTLQALEVTLRNALDATISSHYGDALWFDRQPAFLQMSELDKIAAAKQELLRARKPLEPGRIIAELGFGFWTSLLDARYERILWPRLLKATFPAMPRRIRTRQTLPRRLNQIRKLRNRVFHHESILNWSNPGLEVQHSQLIEIIRWMNPAMAETAALIDRFPAIHTQGYLTCKAKIEQHLKGVPTP